MINSQKIIETWFEREWGGALLFPDGWFGRPFDNQHMLNEIKEKNGALELLLDDGLLLRFHGLKNVKDSGKELRFSNFEKCEFNWDREENPMIYQDGEIKVVASSVS